ncbi:MAG: serine acetyltransferase [Streptococcaceae bacterium]|nr:serine acetyltransferase [Streptococcaceae bacterium]
MTDLDSIDFEELVEINCFSENAADKAKAAELLEKDYNCQIVIQDMARDVKFAHHARGSIIIAAKLSRNVVIMQNVTIDTNMRYNKLTEQWENVGNPILDENVIVADGAKILGPVIIGENTVIGAGAIVTKDIPANSVAFGVNSYKPKDPNYDLLFNDKMLNPKEIIAINNQRIEQFKRDKSV